MAFSYFLLATYDSSMRDYTKYDTWRDAIDISVKIYDVTRSFPDEEKFGIISQVRRASVSISSYFAEGCSRSSEKDFNRFIQISIGSAFELKTQLIISRKLDYINNEDFETLINLIDKVSKQLNTLRNKLK